MGSWRSGTQQPAVLRSAWYRLPADWSERSVLSIPLCGRAASTRAMAGAVGRDDGERQAASASPMSARSGLAEPEGAAGRDPSRRNAGAAVATDDDLAPQHWIALPRRGIPQLNAQIVGAQDPVLDWLVGLAFPCQRPFDHQNGVIEVPKWRILPDRFGAEANSPVMDNVGGGPLGISELLLRATTVPTYLKDDWFRDWGELQQFTPYYRNAQPARLDLGSATRSGLWSPAPLRH
jgi:arabinosyltransferase C